MIHLENHGVDGPNFPRQILIDGAPYVFKDVVRDSMPPAFIDREKIIALIYENEQGETLVLHRKIHG